MGPRRRLLIGSDVLRRRLPAPLLVALAALLHPAPPMAGQPPTTTDSDAFASATSAPSRLPAQSELPPELANALASIEDFTYDFDHPAYYALLEFVQNSQQPPGFTQPPIVITDWRTLIERPADFRGRAVTLTGVVGRNKDPYIHPRHPQLGRVWQVELSRRDTPITATVVFTNDVSDLPLGAAIRLTGYFVKVNQYPTKTGQPGLAALIVSPGPTEVTRAASRPGGPGGLDWRWLLFSLALAMGVIWLLLRRWARRTNIEERRVNSE